MSTLYHYPLGSALGGVARLYCDLDQTGHRRIEGADITPRPSWLPCHTECAVFPPRSRSVQWDCCSLHLSLPALLTKQAACPSHRTASILSSLWILILLISPSHGSPLRNTRVLGNVPPGSTTSTGGTSFGRAPHRHMFLLFRLDPPFFSRRTHLPLCTPTHRPVCPTAIANRHPDARRTVVARRSIRTFRRRIIMARTIFL